MVSRFVSNSKPKNKKNGPHGRAHLSISKAVQQSSSLKSRKAMGRRIGTKRNRQKRDVHIVHKAGPDIIGKFFYHQWDVSKIAGQEIMVTPVGNGTITVDEDDVISQDGFKSATPLCSKTPYQRPNKKTVTWSDIVRGKNSRMKTNDNGLILLK